MKKHISIRLSALLLVLLLTLSACTPSTHISTTPTGTEGSTAASPSVTPEGSEDPSSPTGDTSFSDPTDSSEASTPDDPAPPPVETEVPALTQPKFDLSAVPAYKDSAFVHINGGIPSFTENQHTTQSYEYYSSLDALGRCGTTVACVGPDLMPTGDRGSISSVTPSGWVQAQYDIVSGKYLYNRAHLIGWQLTGENANKQNLITGTKYFNVSGMLPFENMVADYIKETGNHVLYRVTPIYNGNDLVVSGVHMEAWSVEDEGDGICFNVFVYNVQPGIIIDYATGSSRLENGSTDESTGTVKDYVLNTNSKKFHFPDCKSAAKISAGNRKEYTGTREDLIADGYSPCGNCKP